MEERKIFNDETKQTLTYFGSVLNIHTKLSKYTQKDEHKEQNDLLNNIDYVAIKDGILSEQQNFQNKILKIIEKSKQNNSYKYLQVKCYGHVFFLCIHGDKILLIDSLDLEESENYSYRQIEFENNSFFQKNNIFFRRIGIDQQKSKIGCPVFTVRNLIKLDKFFKENPDYFDKIFETKTEIEEDGMKILPLFPLLQDIQSISRIEELSGIKIQYDTEPKENDFVIENHKKEKIIINVKDEEKAKIFFGSTKKEQEEKLKKLVKYIEFDITQQKLQNLRIEVKRKKYYKNLEKASDKLLDYVNEKVVNSLC